MNSNSTAIILAGGRSLRMGFDKQLLRLNDEYLLEKNLLILQSFSRKSLSFPMIPKNFGASKISNELK